MGKGAFVGIDGIARKIKGGYIGIDGVARKIKSAYIGVGGVARPCWGEDKKIEYYGSLTPFLSSEPKVGHAGSNIGSYALFAGGSSNGAPGSPVGSVYAYNANLVQSNPASLSNKVARLAGARNTTYALFAGGGRYNRSKGYNVTVNTVNAYNSSLVKSAAAIGLQKNCMYLGGVSLSNYALFGGGHYETSSGSMRSVYYVTAFSNDLVAVSMADLTNSGVVATANVDIYGLFCVGNCIEVYNENLAKCTSISGSYADRCAGAHNAKYALFAGGQLNTSLTDKVYAVNKDLVLTTPSALSEVREFLTGASHDDFCLFAGGRNSNASLYYRRAVDSYDCNLVKKVESELVYNRSEAQSATVGNYMLIAGGVNATTSVEAYMVS